MKPILFAALLCLCLAAPLHAQVIGATDGLPDGTVSGNNWTVVGWIFDVSGRQILKYGIKVDSYDVQQTWAGWYTRPDVNPNTWPTLPVPWNVATYFGLTGWQSLSNAAHTVSICVVVAGDPNWQCTAPKAFTKASWAGCPDCFTNW